MAFSAFKTKLQNNQPVFGVVLRSAALPFAELVGLTGFDFAWIDLEHSNLGFQDVERLKVALENHGCVSLVRVPTNDASSVGQVLDLGADIVDVPHIDTPEEARAVVHSAKYFPMGRRGVSSCSRANRQGIDALSLETMRRINGENLVMVQVESKKGMENVREIAQVDGIDILFLGLGDLSQDFGIPGQFGHSKIMGAIREFSGAVSEAGKTAGAPVSDPERIDEFVRLGFRLFSCGVDVILFKNALQHLIQNINSRVRA